MIHHFNHRFGDYADRPDGSENTSLPDVSLQRLGDLSYEPFSRYWIDDSEVEGRLRGRWDGGGLLGWRDITNATNERTVIATVVPRVGVGNNLAVSLLADPALTGCLVANVSAFVFDFTSRAARQCRIGGGRKMNPSFSIDRKSVRDLLSDVEARRFAIPKLQREFVWDGEDAAEMRLFRREERRA